ncbi:fimbrial protein [Klebsiella aerogenes]
MLRQRIITGMGLLTVFCFFGVKTSEASCRLNSDAGYLNQAANITIPLSGTISATEGLALGSMLYRNVSTTNTLKVNIVCDKIGTYYVQRNLSPLPPIVNDEWTPGPGYGSPTYKTSIPGVGIWLDSESGEGKEISPECQNTNTCIYKTFNQYFMLRKIGKITPGVLNGSSLPRFTVKVGHSDSMVDVVNVSFSGSITINSPTCVTPDVSVEMGKWSVSSFTGKNSTTEWRDASIKMMNCDRFYGWHQTQIHNLSGLPESTTMLNDNMWSLQLTPQHGVINNSSGIMDIDKSIDKSASGIGIQLSYGSTSSAGSDLVNFSNIRTDSIPTAGQSTITIPIAARYIQTDDRVTPGKADGKLMFTISYK